MSRRKRRKTRPVPRGFPVFVVIGFMVLFGAIGFGVWKVWPTVRDRARAVLSRVVDLPKNHVAAREKMRETPPAPESDEPRATPEPKRSQSLESRLVRRNAELAAEVQRLRGEVERKNELLLQREEELKEIKLRLLIHEKTQNQ